MNGWSDERMDKELMDGQMNDVRKKASRTPLSASQTLTTMLADTSL